MNPGSNVLVGDASAVTNSPRMPTHLQIPVAVLGLSGLALTAYLAIGSWRGGAIAGCTHAGGCGQALHSSWAWWLGVPISALAAAIYLAVLTSIVITSCARTRQRQQVAWIALVAAAFTLIEAAVWCMYLLIFRLRTTCPYCTASHVLGAATAGLVLYGAGSLRAIPGSRARLLRPSHWVSAALIATVGMVLLIGGQIVFPTATYALVNSSVLSATHTAKQSREGDDHSEVRPDPETGDFYHMRDGRRVIAPAFTDVVLDPQNTPVLGSPNAPHLLVFFFDYKCEACMQTHRLLHVARERFGEQIAVVMVTCPADRQCNPLFKNPAMQHPGACQYARLGLALWRASPQAFGQFDDWLLDFASAPPLDVTLAKCIELVGRRALQAALAEPWVEQQLKQNVKFSEPVMRHFGGTPILMLDRQFMQGIPDDPEAFCEILERQLGINPVAPAASP